MKFPQKRFMFTVKDISQACGISRTTLLRMEESGFLTPYYIDPDSGYRYYDADNITQIGQYRLLQQLGLTRDEISDFYYQRIDNKAFIKEQRIKLNNLSRLLNIMEMQYDPSNDYTFNFIEVPETTCYCATISESDIPDAESNAYDLYQKMISEGFKLNVTERMFFIAPPASDHLSPKAQLPVINFEMCVPIIPQENTDERIRVFPPEYAIATVVHGDYSVTSSMIKNIFSEVLKRGLKPSGPLRIVPLIAPCTGEHYAPDDFCYECILPVER